MTDEKHEPIPCAECEGTGKICPVCGRAAISCSCGPIKAAPPAEITPLSRAERVVVRAEAAVHLLGSAVHNERATSYALDSDWNATLAELGIEGGSFEAGLFWPVYRAAFEAFVAHQERGQLRPGSRGANASTTRGASAGDSLDRAAATAA